MFSIIRLDMLTMEGRFVEYGVFGSTAAVDWSLIAIKGTDKCILIQICKKAE